MRLASFDLLAVAAGENHIAFCFNLVCRSIGAEGDRRLVRGAATVGIIGYVLKQVKQAAGAIELCMMGMDGQRVSPDTRVESHVGGQDDDSCLRVEAGASRAAGCFGQAKLNFFRGAGEARLLVEDQVRGFDMNSVLAFAFLGRRFAGL